MSVKFVRDARAPTGIVGAMLISAALVVVAGTAGRAADLANMSAFLLRGRPCETHQTLRLESNGYWG
jgi:hypothetical protein